jgi:HAD superfamily hydrolase (TIGR01509 family)
MLQPGLLIFDCDGVLVDSEPLAMRVLLDAIAEAGLTIESESGYERFLGKDLATITELLSEEYGVDLTHSTLERMRQRLYELFRRELKPIPGIVAALDAIDLPCCVASSSQMGRVRLALEVTGLRSRFEPNVFTASMVARGKPAPDLFLYAAKAMETEPTDCVVIEDSASGVEAAQRAGMRVFAFTGGAHARRAAHHEALGRLNPTLIFDDMRQLPAHLGLASPIEAGV